MLWFAAWVAEDTFDGQYRLEPSRPQYHLLVSKSRICQMRWALDILPLTHAIRLFQALKKAQLAVKSAPSYAFAPKIIV